MSSFTKLFKDRLLIKEYDKNIFCFYQIFSVHCLEVLNCPNLENLHEFIPRPKGILKVREDQKTFGHKLLYQVDPAYQNKIEGSQKPVKNRGFIQLYEKFVQFLEKDVFLNKLVYQKLPTFRIHLPENLSVGEYHRDYDYNHPVEEINLWVPLTRAEETASLYIESSCDAGDYKPLHMQYGQCAIFDSCLKHGNEINTEGYTRVSFDFRVIPISHYKNSSLASINQKMKFMLGEYYKSNDV